jgi:hypothetical protein
MLSSAYPAPNPVYDAEREQPADTPALELLLQSLLERWAAAGGPPNGEVAAEPAQKEVPAEPGASPVVGRLVGAAGGEPLVDFAGNPSGQPIPARSTQPWDERNFGQEAVLLFESGDPRRPLLMGFLQPGPVAEPKEVPAAAEGQGVEITVDDQRVTFTAAREIVFRCGQASIHLTSSGKILIRGEYILSRAAGANRIKGGSVQIN